MNLMLINVPKICFDEIILLTAQEVYTDTGRDTLLFLIQYTATKKKEKSDRCYLQYKNFAFWKVICGHLSTMVSTNAYVQGVDLFIRMVEHVESSLQLGYGLQR